MTAMPCGTAISRCCSAGSNPIQLYDSQNNFAPYANNMGVPIVNPVAKFLFANPKLLSRLRRDKPGCTGRGKCLTPTDGIAQNNYQAPHAQLQGQ